MRRYTPRIHVLESPNGIYFDYKLRKEFYFSEMEFIAVSQYRNKNVSSCYYLRVLSRLIINLLLILN